MRKKQCRLIRNRTSKFSCFESLDTRHTSVKSTSSIDKRRKSLSASQPHLRRDSLLRSKVLPQKAQRVICGADLSYIKQRQESHTEQDSVFMDLATALEKVTMKQVPVQRRTIHRRSYLTSPYNSEPQLPSLQVLQRRDSSPSLTQLPTLGRRLAK